MLASTKTSPESVHTRYGALKHLLDGDIPLPLILEAAQALAAARSDDQNAQAAASVRTAIAELAAKAIEWQQASQAQHTLLANLLRQLKAFPGAHHSEYSRRVYGQNWQCEPRAGTCTLNFELPPELTLRVLAAYYELINGPSPDRKPAEMQQAMFPTGDDLPLFTSKRTEE